MAETTPSPAKFADLVIPLRQVWGLEQQTSIAAPSYESFTSRFGHAFPKPQFLESDLGATAVYDLPPPSGTPKRPVLFIHGANTPALGMLALAKALQTLDPDAHVVLFDNWGHGLSSTPLVAHTPQIFHFQIYQVLGFMRWPAAHFVGYSFGASTALTFATHNPWAALSVVVLAPAGLLRMKNFSPRFQQLLTDSAGRESEAIEAVLGFLEGGPLVVPEDARERMHAGESVAPTLREWELQEHVGFPHSLLSLFRFGGVYDCDESFRVFAQRETKKIVVIAEFDDVCSKSQLEDLGFGDNIVVVENADHEVARSKSGEVASIVHRFWTR